MFMEDYKREDYMVMEKEDLINLVMEYKQDKKDLQDKIDDLNFDIDNLNDEIGELELQLDEDTGISADSISDDVVDYESLIYILNRDNMLTDELKNEIDYIKRYHNNLDWVNDL